MTRFSKHLTALSILIQASFCASQNALAEGSPYISKVYEYTPAPGQFINELPEYESGDNTAAILEKAAEQIAGSRNPGMLSLGAFGGYVVFGFDHTIANMPGDYDFRIYGNAIIADRDAMGGSCEAGIIFVSRDVNGNGLPDDPWYEIAGSAYDASTHDFSVTYYKPSASHTPTPDPDNKRITDTKYIRYTSSEGKEGYLTANVEHLQSYWPEWTSGDTLTFSGTRLPDNAIDISGNGTYFVLKMFDWGYADNCPNSSDPGVKIDWAVDEQGNQVNLDGIDFIKVQTGLLQVCGQLGETSTEICGAEDLHPDAELSVRELPIQESPLAVSLKEGSVIRLSNSSNECIPVSIYRADGTMEANLTAAPGLSDHTLSGTGLFIVKSGNMALKIVNR